MDSFILSGRQTPLSRVADTPTAKTHNSLSERLLPDTVHSRENRVNPDLVWIPSLKKLYYLMRLKIK